MEAEKSHHLLYFSGIVQFGSEGLRTRWAEGVRPSPSPKTRSTHVWKQEMIGVPAHAKSKCDLPPCFSSIQGSSGLEDAHPHWWGWSSLLSLLIQMLISSRNTLTKTPRNNVLPAIWASFSPVKLTHKINHHSWLPEDTSLQFRYWWASPKKDKANLHLGPPPSKTLGHLKGPRTISSPFPISLSTSPRGVLAFWSE